MAEWTRQPPVEPGRYRARFISDGRSDGVYEVVPGTKGGRPVLLACWLGKWYAVEDIAREWQGPLEPPRSEGAMPD